MDFIYTYDNLGDILLEKRGRNMSLLRMILENSIKDKIGHKPSKDEFTSAIEYLKSSIEGKTDLTSVETLLLDWRHDCCIKCENCEDYFLADDMIDGCYGWFCSEECQSDYEKEMEYDRNHKHVLQGIWNE